MTGLLSIGKKKWVAWEAASHACEDLGHAKLSTHV